MEDVGRILPSLFKKEGRLGGAALVEILAAVWARVTGKPIAQHSRPISFEAGTLTLVISCPSWTGQLRQMAGEIKAEINRFLGGPVVKKLRFQYVPDLPEQSAETRASKIESHSMEIPLPTLDFRNTLDPDLARMVERSFAKYFARHGRKVA